MKDLYTKGFLMRIVQAPAVPGCTRSGVGTRPGSHRLPNHRNVARMDRLQVLTLKICIRTSKDTLESTAPTRSLCPSCLLPPYKNPCMNRTGRRSLGWESTIFSAAGT